MKNLEIVLRRLLRHSLFFVAVFMACHARPIELKAATQETRSGVFQAVELKMIRQQRLPKIRPGKEANKDSDIYIVVEDDLSVRLRLTNKSNDVIYYLVSLPDFIPAGYILYRESREKEWKSTSPLRGRDGSLTGDGYKWLPLQSEKSIEFEFTDLSTRQGDHAVSIIINRQPDHANREEIISDTYHPLSLQDKK